MAIERPTIDLPAVKSPGYYDHYRGHSDLQHFSLEKHCKMLEVAVAAKLYLSALLPWQTDRKSYVSFLMQYSESRYVDLGS